MNRLVKEVPSNVDDNLIKNGPSKLELVRNSVVKLTGSLLPKINNFNSIENLEKREELELISEYSKRNPDFFSDFIVKNKELTNGQYIEEKLESYLIDFFNALEPALKDSYLSYEKVVNYNLNLLYNEGLFRTNSKDIEYIEILDIYTKFGKSLDITYTVLETLVKDIKNGNVNIPASINIEVSDLMNPEFINKFRLMIKKYDLNIDDGMIIFEILENQKLHLNNELFNYKLEELGEIGIHFALDDIMKKNTHLETNKNIIEALDVHKSLKIVKIFGEYLQELHISHKEGLVSEDELLKIKSFFLDISSKGFKIVAEWIETVELFLFAKNKLGIEYFQGFLFNEIYEP